MKNTLVAALAAALLTFLAPGRARAQERPVVFSGAKVYTITDGVYDPGVVVIRDGVIQAVGTAAEVETPDGARVRDVSDMVIMPGLVDTHSHVAIGGDTNEGSAGLIFPALQALDAIDPSDPSVRMAQAGGVTTANIMPGSGNLMGGQTAYVKMRGETIGEMLICDDPLHDICGGMKMANGTNPQGDEIMTRMGAAALQREIFVEAQRYMRAWERWRSGEREEKPEKSLRLEPIAQVLRGERVVHFHTHRADDIMTAMRLADEFGFRMVLQHASEGYQVADEIAERGYPASIIVLDAPGGKHEAADYSLALGAALEDAGVKVAIHTDDWITESRLLLRSAALAVRAGMSKQGALAALTQNAAEMLGLGDRVGSLEPGEDADLIVLSGEPFSTYTHVLETWIEGEKVFDWDNPEDRRYATGGYGVEDYPELPGFEVPQ